MHRLADGTIEYELYGGGRMTFDSKRAAWTRSCHFQAGERFTVSTTLFLALVESLEKALKEAGL
jgi:hypothetical protein